MGKRIEVDHACCLSNMQHVHHRLVASLGNGCSTALEEPDIRREGLRRHNWLSEKHHALPQPLAALLA